MAHTLTLPSWRVSIYVNAFLVGSVLMGFEMLGSRYLFPYFGGGMDTWAGLISTVLVALAIGYFTGGALADRYPTIGVIALSIAAAAGYLAIIPSTADSVVAWILDAAGANAGGVLLSAVALTLIPLSLLGMYSPIAVRLLVRSTDESGRVAGLVYGFSTIGNVFGTLLVTFALIPTIGSRSITYLLSAILLLCATHLILLKLTGSNRRAPA
jgi:hypothetical protein